MSGTPLKMIVGLGNPGPEHLLTRHNAGFWFVDALAAKLGGRFRSHTKFQGEICRAQFAGAEITLLKPSTYMNRSGLAIRALSDYLKVSPGEILIAHDELDLPVGDARFKLGGGHGGHNGLRDAITHMGADFWRLRRPAPRFPGRGRKNSRIDRRRPRRAAGVRRAGIGARDERAAREEKRLAVGGWRLGRSGFGKSI
jgi:aminoacyl-tRNA hydrolase